jgi:hypothetical protein
MFNSSLVAIPTATLMRLTVLNCLFLFITLLAFPFVLIILEHSFYVKPFVGLFYTFVSNIFHIVTPLYTIYRYIARRFSLQIHIITILHCILATYAFFFLFALDLVLFYCRLSLQIGILYYDLQA